MSGSMTLLWAGMIALILVCIVGMVLILWSRRKRIRTVQDPTGKSGSFLRALSGKIDALLIGLEDEELKRALEGLKEDIRYSEPGVGISLDEIDDRISGNFDMLKESLEERQTERAFLHVKKLKQLIAERNAKIRSGA
ncbi:MAG: hypothetical protein Q4F41_00245 [Eubacteriales bacterium]|nr:hypothetical protein [Eubacteriales bacterium]